MDYVSVVREIMYEAAQSVHEYICLACKMRSGREKQAIGKVKLTSSRS